MSRDSNDDDDSDSNDKDDRDSNDEDSRDIRALLGLLLFHFISVQKDFSSDDLKLNNLGNIITVI